MQDNISDFAVLLGNVARVRRGKYKLTYIANRVMIKRIGYTWQIL